MSTLTDLERQISDCCESPASDKNSIDEVIVKMQVSALKMVILDYWQLQHGERL